MKCINGKSISIMDFFGFEDPSEYLILVAVEFLIHIALDLICLKKSIEKRKRILKL